MAASIPHQYCSDYTDFCSFSLNSDTHTNISEETSVHNTMYYNNMNNLVPLISYDMNSPVSVASFPDQQYFGVSDNNYMAAVQQLPEIEMGFRDFTVCDYKHRQLFEHGAENSNDFWQSHNPRPSQNWTIQGKPVTKIEETEVKVERYSVEERKDRILRYLKKRNQRNFNKTIKYACRKTLADKRVRVRGRFAKNNSCEHSEEEIVLNKTHDIIYQQNNSLYQDSFQMKYDEDEWLQTAVANLVQLPYILS